MVANRKKKRKLLAFSTPNNLPSIFLEYWMRALNHPKYCPIKMETMETISNVALQCYDVH
jgi:hypothetical protein